ncbi:hypothetical protein PYW07_017210 [Mythimna separata]|uniref:Citrate transporter-like domain-containing protein n=1 Tax=Mythimna separata TaxID=271217 RepID=A0AAD8DX78_MYTSE|nr:hypothetical protein PYW07_017210 [Mythimna separata]
MAPKKEEKKKEKKQDKKKGDKKGEEPESSALGRFSSYLTNPFKKLPTPKTPIAGFGERAKNCAKNNFRGILGVLVPLLVLSHQFERFNSQIKLWLMWQWILWFYLVRPMAIPCTSIIPIFFLPMVGIYDSGSTCKCYINEGVMLYVLSAYLVALLNNSGFDKRICLWFLCLGDKFSGKMLLIRASTAAFFLSMFSSRLIVTHTLTQYVTTAFEKIEPGRLTITLSKNAADVTAMRYVVNNAIQTSASFGGLGIIHSSWVTLLFRACYNECVPPRHENPDLFNYIQYTAFAFPVTFCMFILNLIYHVILMVKVEGSGLGGMQAQELQNSFLRNKSDIPSSITMHEVYSVIFEIILLGVLFTRDNNRFIEGWALPVENSEIPPPALRVKDATVAAIFVIILHVLPKGFDFLKLFSISRRKDLPPVKPESGILWWRFVDKCVNYGYIFTFGCAIALLRAGISTKIQPLLAETAGSFIFEQSWDSAIFMCVLISAILSNAMPGIAACAIFLPYIMLVAQVSVIPWPTHYFLPSVGMGMAFNLGFCAPFKYTPAYYCHFTGRVPILKMAKYSIPSVLIGVLVIFGATTQYAPSMFNPNLMGIQAIRTEPDKDLLKKLLKAITNTTTPATTTVAAAVKADEAAPEAAPAAEEET